MSDGIRNKIGPYLYADGAIADRAFAGGREFKIVIAGAFDAGIIGPEHNGIAILDESFSSVLLDQHLIESTGYFGPSERQKAELARIGAMDWAEFSKFVREHPRYRKNSMPDAFDPKPLTIEPEKDRVVFPASAKGDTGPYSFPLETSKDIANFLSNHTMHRVDGPYSKWSLAWNIKVGGMDGDAKSEVYRPDPQFDARWTEHAGRDGFFWEVAGDGLHQYVEGEFTTYDGDDGFRFSTTGRSGGWLILTHCGELAAASGHVPLSWEGQSEMKEWVRSLSDEELVRLYKLVVTVDHDLADPKAIMEEAYAARRASLEEEWKGEATLSHA